MSLEGFHTKALRLIKEAEYPRETSGTECSETQLSVV